ILTTMEKKIAVNKDATKTTKDSGKSGSMFATLVIPIAFIIAYAIYYLVLGNPDNFEGGDNNNHPISGNYLGIVYKGGFVVGTLIALNLLVLIFAIERFLTISKAKGSKGIEGFVRVIRQKLNLHDVNGAIAACDAQKGSVANVVKSGLHKYKEMQVDNTLPKDQKVLAIQKEIEETTALELPMLEKNLVIISTIASI